jgi:hypothetical protein
MDDSRFDEIAKALGTTTTRRATLARLAGGIAGALALTRVDQAAARGKKNKKGKKDHDKDEDHKTCICHSTGSFSNPFVLICVDNHALKAHKKHGDFIPAPIDEFGRLFCPKKKFF